MGEVLRYPGDRKRAYRSGHLGWKAEPPEGVVRLPSLEQRRSQREPIEATHSSVAFCLAVGMMMALDWQTRLATQGFISMRAEANPHDEAAAKAIEMIKAYSAKVRGKWAARRDSAPGYQNRGSAPAAQAVMMTPGADLAMMAATVAIAVLALPGVALLITWPVIKVAATVIAVGIVLLVGRDRVLIGLPVGLVVLDGYGVYVPKIMSHLSAVVLLDIIAGEARKREK